MGLFSWGRRDPNAELREQVEAATLQAELRALSESLNITGNLVNPWDDFDPEFDGMDRGMLRRDRSKVGDLPQAYLTDEQLRTARERSRLLATRNEYARNALSTRQTYIVGTGFQITPVARRDEDKADALIEAVKEWLAEFEAINAWGLYQREAVLRTDRDGDGFLRGFFRNDGMTVLRFIEPEYVRDWDGKTPFGVVTDPDDVAKAQGYLVNWEMQGKAEELPAEGDDGFILHVKYTDSGIRRGLPFLYPVFTILNRIEKLDENMATTAAIQAAFALIRKNANARQSAVEAHRANMATVTRTNPLSGQMEYVRQMRGGMIIDSDGNTEYEFPSVGANLAGMVAIKSSLLRTAAAGVQMPEYMLTSDAANGNFASTQVAESPAVSGFMAWQHFWSHQFGAGVFVPDAPVGVLWKAISHAVGVGRLPADVLTRISLEAQGPPVMVRDRQQETNRLKMLRDGGVIDNTTWAQEEGYAKPASEEPLNLDQPQVVGEEDGKGKQKAIRGDGG